MMSDVVAVSVVVVSAAAVSANSVRFFLCVYVTITADVEQVEAHVRLVGINSLRNCASAYIRHTLYYATPPH